MKIIISPAKIQNGKYILDFEYSSIAFKKQQKSLRNSLRTYSKDGIGQLMKIKGKLLDDTYYNLHHKLPVIHAIVLYNGIVFKEINIQSYDSVQLEYMNQHLRILSAYYGILKPSTGITPYRLDMTMKPENNDLYTYWDETVSKCFKKEETIINLASLEFSKMIKHPMINIYFKEEQSDDSLKIVTVRAKKARGLMVDYLVTHLIDSLEGLKAFNEMGYSYSEKLSDNTNIVFVLPYGT